MGADVDTTAASPPWEQGSDFAYPSIQRGPRRDGWLPPSASLWHSGRDALRAVLRALPRPPRRVFFPSFYCQDVYDACERDVELAVYADDPRSATLDARSLEALDGAAPADVVIVSNTFALRGAASPVPSDLANRLASKGVLVIEDHTHDPFSAWARGSTADHAFASLRKWLPLPDGGVAWSPSGRASAPPAPAFDPYAAHGKAAAVTLDRLTGMLMKQRYLAGEAVDKEAFRARSIAGEQAIGHDRSIAAPMSPLSRALLAVLPTDDWYQARLSNHRVFVEALGDAAHLSLRILSASAPEGHAPFAIALELASEALRDKMKRGLVEERVYPAILWPIDGGRIASFPSAHAELSRRVLCLHCDHRYGPEDMTRLASIVKAVVRRAGAP